MSNFKDYSRQKFNEWTLIKFYKKIKSNTYWLAQCSCGKIKISHLGHIRYGNSKSCGKCGRNLKQNNSNWTGHGDIYGKYFSSLRNGAKKRNIIFKITIEYIWKLFLQQNRKCALSGILLNFASNIKNSNGTASLDRIDSSKGYIEGNVQWIHKDINFMKQDMSDKDFINWCKIIAKNWS